MRKSTFFFGALLFALSGTLLFPAHSAAQTSGGATQQTQYHGVHVYKFVLVGPIAPEVRQALMNEIKASQGVLEVAFDEATNTLSSTTKKQIPPTQIKAFIVAKNISYSRFTDDYVN